MSESHHPFFNPEEAPLSPMAPTRKPKCGSPIVTREPFLKGLRYDLTPAGLHYLLIHFDVPFVPTAETWTLTIGGLVDNPLQVNLDDLKRRSNVTLPVTLECAGNGRAGITPRRQSQPWLHEAVGTAKWTGTPLKPLLEEAGFKDTAQEVVFYGRDRGFSGGIEHDYGRSLSTTQALSDDVLLVWAMNDAPLLPQHGIPAALIVPGWYGMASVKWLERIDVIDRPFDGYQQVGTYIYRASLEETGVPITTILVKSLMVPPGLPDVYTRSRLVDQGSVALFGRAWSGGSVAVDKVEVSIDGIWHAATLDPEQGRYAWRGWRFDWQAEQASTNSCAARPIATAIRSRLSLALTSVALVTMRYNACR